MSVVDNRIAHQVKAFDRSGRYRFTFGAQGHGPGEYTEMTGAALTPDGKYLAIADQIAADILKKTGEMAQPLSPQVLELVDGLDENSNPVIFLYDLRLPE